MASDKRYFGITRAEWALFPVKGVAIGFVLMCSGITWLVIIGARHGCG